MTRSRVGIRTTLMFVIAVAASGSVGLGQTYTWTGATNSTWTTGTNWDLGTAPPYSSGITTIINSGTAQNPPNVQDGARVNWQLTGGTLNIDSGTWRYGYETSGNNLITVGGGSGAANLNRNSNSSSANMFGGASFLMGLRQNGEQAIRVIANGTVKVRSASATPSPFNDTLVGPTFDNNFNANARINLETGGRWDNGSKMFAVGYNATTQKGFFNFTGGQLANVSTYLGVSRINRDYPQSSVNWNLVDFSTQTTLLQQGGTILPGTVTYPGNAFANAVENPIGLMTIYGDYTQLAAGTLSIDLAGTSISQYDRLSVVAATAVSGGGSAGGGTVSLAGLLQINPISGFTPQPGDTFNVLTAATSIDTTGMSISPGYTFQVLGGNTLQVAVVPEPSSMALAGIGAIGAGIAIVRRRARPSAA